MSDNKELNEDKLKNLIESEAEDRKGLRGRFKITIIALLLIAVAAYVVVGFLFDSKTYYGYDVVAEYKKDLPEDMKYDTDYGKLIGYNNEGISIYNKGELEWNAAISMTNPKLAVSKGYAVVADIGGRNILVVNHKSVPAVQVSLQMLQDIMMVDISEQGEIAVLMEADKGYNIQLLNPYDKNEKLKAEIKTYSKDDGYALSLAMSKDGSKLVTEYVKSDNNEIKSTLTFYNFDKVGENSNADRIVGVFPFEDTIFPKLKFTDNNTVCAYGDNKIVCFAAKREPELLWEKKIEGKIERIAEDGSGFSLLINNDDMKSVLYSFNYSGNIKFQTEVDINARGMWSNNGEVALYSDSNCVIFSAGGDEKFKNKFGDKIISFMPADGSLKYYAVLGKKLKLIKLTE